MNKKNHISCVQFGDELWVKLNNNNKCFTFTSSKQIDSTVNGGVIPKDFSKAVVSEIQDSCINTLLHRSKSKSSVLKYTTGFLLSASLLLSIFWIGSGLLYTLQSANNVGRGCQSSIAPQNMEKAIIEMSNLSMPSGAAKEAKPPMPFGYE